GLWWARRRAPLVAAGAALPLALLLAYNLEATGNIAGGYGLAGHAAFFQGDLLAGIAGLLLSPTRGLFVFSPFLLFVPFCFRRVLSDRGARGLTVTLGLAVIFQTLIYAKADWRAGASWGPRWLTDLLPLLIWMLPPVVAALRGAGRLAFVLAVCAAISIEAVGAFWYTHASDRAIFAVAAGPDRMRAAWDLRNAPFLAELRHPRAAGDLALGVQGRLERVSSGGRDVQAVTAGEDLLLEGRALTNGRSPRRVVVLLDGQAAGSTTDFFEQFEAGRAPQSTRPANWRVAVTTRGLPPGEHLLAIFAKSSDRGDLHLLAQRRFAVLAAPPSDGRSPIPPGRGPRSAEPRPNDPLESAFEEAKARIREDQQAAGYWLTSHTRAPRFEDPKREMNTFLTSMIVDLLEPSAATAGLGESLERARRHLTAQIEANGLVRYHGRPDARTIPALGCVITPDADDTALVWRIAPGRERSQRSDALKVLEQYRTRDGLYRTWLAPRARYQCIDPGRDPNPADVGIQMHVLLFLAREDPAAARALCGALQRAIGEDRIWVYYREAPLVPILRQADLGRAGCKLTLPASRLSTSVPGQEIWVAACKLLKRFLTGEGPPPAQAETLAVLGSLSDDGFSSLRREPPLLYHNDLTASTPRFYWSEDFGYALWLRLYFENAHRR
ncbi:MAG: hypothetical protein ACRD16_07210, partial [Thermoanaerobaculia bacterium]